MARLTIVLDMDNDAFMKHPHEAARILRRVVKDMLDFGIDETETAKLFDINGNSCGIYKVEL